MLRRSPERFLRKITGVVHVGAHVGQERELYAKHGLPVIWIEPIPELFKMLRANLRGFPRQRALEYLVTDKDDFEYQLHVASNEGASSSILDLKLHTDIWPEVTFEDAITLRSKTLPRLLQDECVDLSELDALVLDTQGSELLVLEGAVPILRNFNYIKTEVADFEAYADCCQLADIESFMARHRYREFSRQKHLEHPDGGGYYDIVYRRER